MMIALFVFFAVPLVSSDHAHHYASVESLKNLLFADENIAALLEWGSRIARDDQIKERIETYIGKSEMFLNYFDVKEDPFHHPINGFHFLKHTVHDWMELYPYLLNDSYIYSIYNESKAIRLELNFPVSEDLLHAAMSIVRLMQFYRLPIEQLLQGTIVLDKGLTVLQSTQSLDAWDCNELGKGAMELELYGIALQWFEAAFNRSREGDTSMDMNTVLQNEVKAKQKFDEVSPVTEEEELRSYREFAQSALDPKNMKHITSNWETAIGTMIKLCRGETVEKIIRSGKDSLSCKYFTRNHPFLKIGPLKMEELSREPDVIMFHNFIMEDEIKSFIETASWELQPSTHLDGSKEGVLKSVMKTSKQYWLKNTDKSYEIKIMHRLTAATGLSIEDTPQDPFYVANYGIAGWCKPHVDKLHEYHNDTRFAKNDKFATFIAYLGNVTYGGLTVFPFLGASVPPEKGAAVFWYNSLNDGRVDLLTLHGECPVIYGSKWITNKWAWSSGQIFNSPCGRTTPERRSLQ